MHAPRLSIPALILSLMAVAAQAQPVAPPRAPPESAVAMKSSFAPIVQRTAPAVVNISAKRLVRAQTLAIREEDYVTAAASLGAGRFRILARHVAPQLVGLVVTTVTLNVSGVVINEAVLSLLGLGIQPPDASVGKMISDAMPYLETNTLQVVVPSAILMTIVLAVSFLGDGLRDAFG